MGKIYLNQEGVKVVLETKSDMSTATTTEIQYRKPSGDTGSWAAIVEGTTMYYVTGATDLDQSGIWAFQAHSAGVGFNLFGETATMEVNKLWT